MCFPGAGKEGEVHYPGFEWMRSDPTVCSWEVQHGVYGRFVAKGPPATPRGPEKTYYPTQNQTHRVLPLDPGWGTIKPGFREVWRITCG